MNLNAFLQILEQPEVFQNNNIFIFSSSDYPVLFFSLLKSYVAKFFPSLSRSIDLSTVDFEQLKGELSASFLATSLLYWFGNIDELDAKNKKKFLAFVQAYEGPHCLLYFSIQIEGFAKNNEKVKIIELPKEVSLKAWQELCPYLFTLQKNNRVVLRQIFTTTNRPLSLDAACLLTHYSSLISHSWAHTFINEWLDGLIVPEKSLFSLSTYFFAKKTTLFFDLWLKIKDEYPSQFWIAYWSEQLFRATCFVRLARANKFLEAKKVAYRLPFTLIKSDWRQLSSKELAQAHHFLYDVDHRLKNGGDFFALDLFYSKFFNSI